MHQETKFLTIRMQFKINISMYNNNQVTSHYLSLTRIKETNALQDISGLYKEKPSSSVGYWKKGGKHV